MSEFKDLKRSIAFLEADNKRLAINFERLIKMHKETQTMVDNLNTILNNLLKGITYVKQNEIQPEDPKKTDEGSETRLQ